MLLTEARVDVAARRQAAAALRGFLEGRLTNAELDADYPGASADRAVHEVYFKTWPYQDDLREYRAGEGFTLLLEDRTLLQRCVLFLETDLPYEWPSLLTRAVGWMRRVLVRREPASSSSDPGTRDVWPFYRERDWRLAAERSRDSLRSTPTEP